VKIKFIFLIIFVNFSTFSVAASPFDNMILHEKPINYEKIVFEDYDGNTINLKDHNDEIYIINFWATWCLPCKKEMPSLDKLNDITKIEIFPINVDYKDKNKSKIFFKSLNIQNLSIYFDRDSNLVNLFGLRGIPTTIILNKKKQEIARILGEIDFSNESFINWVQEVNTINF
jgi:Thiol-disulfide isomerase and thioredoxins